MNDKVSINNLINSNTLSFEKFVESDKVMSDVPAVGFIEEQAINKVQKRLKRNRESAITHRKRKKRYIAGLESIVIELNDRMQKLLDENEILKLQIDNYTLNQELLPDLDDIVLNSFFKDQ